MPASTQSPGPRKRLRWRPWLRALHRDAGYLAVGLTVVYALSGLAVNHIGDWDPNFNNFERAHQVDAPLPEDDAAAAAAVLAALDIRERPSEVYPSDADELTILIDHRSLYVTRSTGAVTEVGQRPRLLLRVSNWLHLNRGKRAWTYIADGYAVFLLFLAVSGVFMLPGKKGIRRRGAILVLLGAAVPVLYVTLSGGPGGS
ncbi:MAG: PepSY-associated TM helix domain-containing protein [Myxococcales bacterium]|nr:PepSY-associated TM helix domain-containing protein [Myxococcales bacterium]